MPEIRELKMGVFWNRTGGEGFLFCFFAKKLGMVYDRKQKLVNRAAEQTAKQNVK